MSERRRSSSVGARQYLQPKTSTVNMNQTTARQEKTMTPEVAAVAAAAAAAKSITGVVMMLKKKLASAITRAEQKDRFVAHCGAWRPQEPAAAHKRLPEVQGQKLGAHLDRPGAFVHTAGS